MSLQGWPPGGWQLKGMPFVLGAISSGFPMSLKVQRSRTASEGLGRPFAAGGGGNEEEGWVLEVPDRGVAGPFPQGLPLSTPWVLTLVPCVSAS